MEWNSNSDLSKKEGNGATSKILKAIIACIILVVMLIMALIVILMTNNGKNNEEAYALYIDGKKNSTIKIDSLFAEIEEKVYVDIEEFSKLVGYEYHKGDYKSYDIEGKCYAEGSKETVVFYVDDNTIYKIPTNNREKEYETYELTEKVKSVGNKMYAPINTLSTAFNILVQETNKGLEIYTLDFLIDTYNTKVVELGYESIKEQSFENDKALLYGYLVVKKENGLYKIIDADDFQEIVFNRYSAIEFSEYLQNFNVTDNGKIGIVDGEGRIQIEPNYEEISILSKKDELYLVKQNGKYGVVKANNTIIVFPEYDSIGLEDKYNSKNKYLILDNLIPVYKEKKWGAYDKNGRKVLDIEYDGLGYEFNTISIEGVREVIERVVEIEKANAIVVKKEDKYGLLDINGKILVKTVLDSVYAIPDEKDEKSKYFMMYNGQKINIIQELIQEGLIEETDYQEKEEANNTVVDKK